MKTLRDIIAQGGRTICSVPPDATVYDAIKLMAEQNVGAAVVLEGESLVGILSERDYARKVVLVGKSSKETPVRDIMSTGLVSAGPDERVDACLALMTSRKIRNLPVVENGRLLGVVAILDVCEALISDQQFTISQLEGYISGSPG